MLVLKMRSREYLGLLMSGTFFSSHVPTLMLGKDPYASSSKILTVLFHFFEEQEPAK